MEQIQAVATAVQTVALEEDRPVKYCLYARKSSEDDERQALSIDSQIKEMMLIAKRERLEISEVRKESQSAKASGCRPVYNQLLQDVRGNMFGGDFLESCTIQD